MTHIATKDWTVNADAMKAFRRNEADIAVIKDQMSESAEQRNDLKIQTYAEVISTIVGVKLVKGNLPRAIGQKLSEAMEIDGGVKPAIAKRYKENSVAAMRYFDFPTQATASMILTEIKQAGIFSEAQLAAKVKGESEKDAMMQIAEKLIGKWTTRKDENGNAEKGVFKPSSYDQSDWNRLDDCIRELKEAREAAEVAAKEAALKAEAETALLENTIDAM